MNTKLIVLLSCVMLVPTLFGYCVYFKEGSTGKIGVAIYKQDQTKALTAVPIDYARLGTASAEHRDMSPGSKACWNWKEINKKLFSNKGNQNTPLFFAVFNATITKGAPLNVEILATGSLPLGGGLFIDKKDGKVIWQAYTFDNKLFASNTKA